MTGGEGLKPKSDREISLRVASDHLRRKICANFDLGSVFGPELSLRWSVLLDSNFFQHGRPRRTTLGSKIADREKSLVQGPPDIRLLRRRERSVSWGFVISCLIVALPPSELVK